MGTSLEYMWKRHIHTTNGKGERKKLLIPFNMVNWFASISCPNNIPLIHTTTTNDNAALVIGKC